jgi:ArsR family transcriptional regulator
VDVNERAAIFQLHAEFCKTLSDSNRLLIITELADSERSVSDLANRLGLHQPNVSKHLSLMREHGLVNARREGSTIYYSLSDSRIYDAIRLLQTVQKEQLEKRRVMTSGAS